MMLLGDGISGSLQDDMAVTIVVIVIIIMFLDIHYLLICVSVIMVGICNMVLLLLKDQNEGI